MMKHEQDRKNDMNIESKNMRRNRPQNFLGSGGMPCERRPKHARVAKSLWQSFKVVQCANAKDILFRAEKEPPKVEGLMSESV